MVFVSKANALVKSGKNKGKPKKGIKEIPLKNGQVRYLDSSKKGVRKPKKEKVIKPKKEKVIEVENTEVENTEVEN